MDFKGVISKVFLEESSEGTFAGFFSCTEK